MFISRVSVDFEIINSIEVNIRVIKANYTYWTEHNNDFT